MADVKDGGPVYPQDFPMKSGMSLRDYFAGQALIAMVARTEFLRGNSDDSRAKWAYRLADAMLKAREVTHG